MFRGGRLHPRSTSHLESKQFWSGKRGFCPRLRPWHGQSTQPLQELNNFSIPLQLPEEDGGGNVQGCGNGYSERFRLEATRVSGFQCLPTGPQLNSGCWPQRWIYRHLRRPSMLIAQALLDA